MDTPTYRKLKTELIKLGYGEEIEWAKNLRPCTNAFDFWVEYSWVVVSSGIKNQVARIVWNRILNAMIDGGRVSDVYGHKAKAAAIEQMWNLQAETFREYLGANDKISFLANLPWIGEITKFHLAKNLGIPVCKPDRHLVRIARKYGLTPDAMCERLSREMGDSIAVIDSVIWRAGNLGMI